MQSLLHILSKSLPCFEHKLKLDLKKQVVNSLYCLPNSILMFWANAADENYATIIEELKLIPYIKDHSSTDKQKTQKAKQLFHIYSLHFLLNLYYIPVLNAVNPSTINYLTSTEYFDFNKSATHQLQNLMFVERDEHNTNFFKNSLELQKESTNPIAKFLLVNIVKHGIITRNDTKENVEKLFSKFNFSVSSGEKRAMLIEKAKEKKLNK